ncbi:hypothetical protein LTR62_007235 [Meristemomyces frigidus]|uniref:Uncharacterized protein n=1 Tax=Meristemomyces frigidus TaxID=1508187 RepID=A0AAN7TBD5_9PEZI|nr:hypothetical protein LTR62_007235 [Meristemomyces frigidus]
MDLLYANPLQLATALLAIAIIGFILTQPTSLVQWLQKKNYQYEVTSSLYMLTPTEKFVFNSILFLTFSLLSTACILYLPDHIVTVSKRTYYYFAGDMPTNVTMGELAGQAAESVSKASEAVLGTASRVSDAVREAAAAATATVGREAVGQAVESGSGS